MWEAELLAVRVRSALVTRRKASRRGSAGEASGDEESRLVRVSMASST